ncbi:hypothetical protein D3C87_297830 [compost metagenome]
MEAKNMPEWMLKYAASIGYESIPDYQQLSNKYHREIDDYINNILPRQAESAAMGAPTPSGIGLPQTKQDLFEPKSVISLIDDKYKRQALSIAASKFGYEIPPESVGEHHKEMTRIQEKSSEFKSALKVADRDKSGMSKEDIMADVAHKRFYDKNPEASNNFDFMKEYIRRIEWEDRFPNPLTDPFVPDSVDADKDNIDRIVDNFMSRFSSNKTRKERDKSSDREDIDRWPL